MKTPIFAIAAASLAVTASPALAGENVQKSKMIVQYDDLNLATRSGVERLELRINKAARAVCGADVVQTGSRIASVKAKRCVAVAKASAMQQFASVVEQQRLGG